MLKCHPKKVIIVGYTFLPSINPVSAMNFIFEVTIDMAIILYNICIHRCTFNNIILKLNYYQNEIYIYIIIV